MIQIMECNICKKVSRENLVILGKNICADCEGALVNTDVSDDVYPIYMDKVRDILTAPAKK